MKYHFWKKIASFIATFALLFNSLATPYSVLAQEVDSPTPESTVAPTETPAPTDSPTIEPTAIPTDSPTPESGNLTTAVVENVDFSGVIGLNTNVDSGVLTTDQADYSPTSVAIITGTGLTANKTYTLVIGSSDEPPVTSTSEITTDSNGNFTYSYQLDGNYRPNYKVEIKSGEVVVATVSFTDSEVRNFSATITPTSINTSTSQSYSIRVTGNSNNTKDIKSFTVLLPAGFSSPPTLTTPVNDNDGQSWSITYNSSSRLIKASATGGAKLNKNTNDYLSFSTTTTSPSSASSYEWSTTVYENSDWTGSTFTPTSSQPSVTVNAPADSTPPVITPNVSPSPNGAGWNKTNPTVTWTVTDAESAITSTSGCGSTTVTTETTGTVLTCSATSTGGTSSNSVTIKLDLSKPVISGTKSPDANGAGWNNTNVVVGFSCVDNGPSGLATNTVAGTTLTSDGAGQSFTNTGTCVDNAGNTADSATVSGINIDKTAPTGDINYSTTAPTNGNVTATLVPSESVTVINNDGSTSYLFTDNGTFTFNFTDLAGNTGSATAEVNNIDKTPPEVVSAETQDTNSDGNIDGIKLTFSENINDSMLSLGTPDGWDIQDPVGAESIGTGDSANDNILLLSFGQGPSPDTGNTANVAYTPTGGPTSTHDIAGNELGEYSATATDGASPILLTAETKDSDLNGSIDQIIATFSEDLEDETVLIGNFDVSGYTINSISESNGVVTLFVDENSYNDTGATPQIEVFTSVLDLSGNPAIDKTITALDKAAPVSTFNSPNADSYYNTAIDISGESSDGSGDTVSSVALYYKVHGSEDEWSQITTLDNEGGDEPLDWSYSWTPETDGIYDIKAEATDDSDNAEQSPTVTGVTYDVTNPTGSWTNPIEGQTVSGSVLLNFNADDNLSGIASIIYKYSSDGTVFTGIGNGTWNTTALPLGDYTLRAVVTDKAGNTTNFDEGVGISAVISNESGVGLTTDSATVTWITDRPTKSRVVYDTVPHGSLGTAPNYDYAFSTDTFDSNPEVLNHSVTIGGLSAGIVYYYRTVSAGSPTAVSEQHSFATLSVAGAPTPSGNGGQQILGISTQLPLKSWPVLAYADSSKEEQVLGTETGVTSSPEASPIPQTEKVGLAKWILTHKKISLGISFLVIILSYIGYRLTKKNH